MGRVGGICMSDTSRWEQGKSQACLTRRVGRVSLLALLLGLALLQRCGPAAVHLLAAQRGRVRPRAGKRHTPAVGGSVAIRHLAGCGAVSLVQVALLRALAQALLHVLQMVGWARQDVKRKSRCNTESVCTQSRAQ